MSKEYEGQDRLDIAAKAERDLNSAEVKGSIRNDKSGGSSSETLGVEPRRSGSGNSNS
jgi:hypothetical protein